MKSELDHFVGYCVWAYECWRMNEIICKYTIYDDTNIWNRFGSIFRGYVFSQIAKINDRAGYREFKNLSLEYIAIHYVKSNKYKALYDNFCKENAEFIEAVKTVRDKIESHSDLETYMTEKKLGAFSSGKDEAYFDSLHRMISKAYEELGLGPFPKWPNFIEEDITQFMSKLQASFNTH